MYKIDLLRHRIEELRTEMNACYKQANGVDKKVYEVSRKLDKLTTLYWYLEKQLGTFSCLPERKIG
jgi:hypothetical protein